MTFRTRAVIERMDWIGECGEINPPKFQHFGSNAFSPLKAHEAEP